MRRAMPTMGALLIALSTQSAALVDDVLGATADVDLERALDEVRTDGIDACRAHSAAPSWPSSTARGQGGDELEGEWLGYAALLVQVDRIVGDLSGSPPASALVGPQDAELSSTANSFPVLAQRADPLAVELGRR